MGEFDEYITGLMELSIGGKELKLDVQIKDKRKLKTAYADGTLSEKGLELIDNTMIDILKRSYPNEKPEALDGFYFKYDMDFIQEFMIKVGWAKKEDFSKPKND